jgi:hypothetical protein
MLEVLTVVTEKSCIGRDVALCSPIQAYELLPPSSGSRKELARRRALLAGFFLRLLFDLGGGG